MKKNKPIKTKSVGFRTSEWCQRSETLHELGALVTVNDAKQFDQTLTPKIY